jgi:HAD superfamily hydrolase (TIGR01509 family)
MATPRAVVFDMDGLMFNSEEVYYQVGVELMRRRGREYSRELSDAIMGRPPKDCFERMIQWHALDDAWEALKVESEDVFLAIFEQWLQPMPGLMALLEALESAGLPKAICTSSSRRLAEAALERFDLSRRFQFVLTAENIVRGKPDPEIYLSAAKRFGIPPAEMLVLEDSQTGCRAATASGALTVAVPGEHSRNHDFSPATLIVDDLSDPRLYAAIGVSVPRNAG